ncbi:MAG: hypothetical protein Q8M54_04660 [Desulfobaccales bacterium]|nr:hypothetical protein [Desulfobaccales bacterium]
MKILDHISLASKPPKFFVKPAPVNKILLAKLLVIELPLGFECIAGPNQPGWANYRIIWAENQKGGILFKYPAPIAVKEKEINHSQKSLV